MKLYSPADMSDMLGIQTSTLRKYSALLEERGYTFDKNKRGQRFYTDSDVITLRKFVSLKDSGMTLTEALEGVVIWHKGGEDVAPPVTDTRGDTERSHSDVEELKAIVHKQQESIEKLIQHNQELMQHIQERDAEIMKQLEDVPRLSSSSDSFDIADIPQEELNEELQAEDPPAEEAEETQPEKKSWLSKLFKR